MSTFSASLAELVEFGHILVSADWLDTPRDVLDYMEKPHKWAPEREIWEGCGKPGPDDQGWDWFLAKMEKAAGPD